MRLLTSKSTCALCRGKRWTAIRRASDPLFHANAMKSYMPIFKLAVERFLAKLEQTKPGESLEIVHPLKDLGLEVIGASVFGCACQCCCAEAAGNETVIEGRGGLGGKGLLTGYAQECHGALQHLHFCAGISSAKHVAGRGLAHASKSC